MRHKPGSGGERNDKFNPARNYSVPLKEVIQDWCICSPVPPINCTVQNYLLLILSLPKLPSFLPILISPSYYNSLEYPNLRPIYVLQKSPRSQRFGQSLATAIQTCLYTRTYTMMYDILQRHITRLSIHWLLIGDLLNTN